MLLVRSFAPSTFVTNVGNFSSYFCVLVRFLSSDSVLPHYPPAPTPHTHTDEWNQRCKVTFLVYWELSNSFPSLLSSPHLPVFFLLLLCLLFFFILFLSSTPHPLLSFSSSSSSSCSIMFVSGVHSVSERLSWPPQR